MLIAIAIHGFKNDDSGISGVIFGHVSGDYILANEVGIAGKIIQPVKLATTILIIVFGKNLGLSKAKTDPLQ